MKTKTIPKYLKDGGVEQREESGNELLAFFALLHKIKRRNEKEKRCRNDNRVAESQDLISK